MATHTLATRASREPIDRLLAAAKRCGRCVGKSLALMLAFSVFSVISDDSLAAPKFARTSGTWGTAANWSSASCAVAGATAFPTAADDVTICNGITISVDGAKAANSLVIATGATNTGLTFTAGSRLDVDFDVTVNSPTANNIVKQIVVADQTLVIGGNLVINGGITAGNANTSSLVSVGSGKITVNGNATINGGSVRSTSQLTAGAGIGPAVKITGNLTVNAGSAANVNAIATVSTGTITIDGNLSLNGSNTSDTTTATASVTSTGNLNVGGNVTITGGNGGANSRDTLLTTSTGNVTITGNLNLASTVATTATTSITGAGTIAVNGPAGVTNGDLITVGAGSFGVMANYSNSSATIGSSTTVSTGQLNVTGNLTNSTAAANTVADSILLSSTGSITVGGTLTNNTNATTSGTITTSTTGTINANGDFLNNGTFVHSAAGRLNLRGANATMNGTFTRTLTTGIVASNKTTGGAQALSGTALAFSNFVMNSVNGVTLGANAAVNTLLTFTSGTITTGANSVIIATAGTILTPTATSYVAGNFQKNYIAGANLSYFAGNDFPVGDATNFTPLAITAGTTTTAGSLLVSTLTSDHPQVITPIASTGIDAARSVNRYWRLNNTGLTVGTAITAIFNFAAGDRDSAADTPSYIVERYDGTNWNPTTAGAANALDTTASNITPLIAGINDFAVGVALPGFNGVPGAFNVFEVATPSNSILGRIYTKIVGTTISLQVIAVNAGRTGVNTLYNTNPITVELLDARNNSVVPTVATDCRSTWAPPGGPAVISSQSISPVWTNGRSSTIVITAPANAWLDVRVRVTQGVNVGCSTDNFSIRPTGFTSVTSNMTNVTTGGTPKTIAGTGTFDLTATTGLTGYTGTPKIDSTAVQAHVNKIQDGTLSGVFPVAVAGTSTATGAFTYSEVGNFKLLGSAATVGSTAARGVYDDSFTAVDGASDCTADFSNALSGGKYGCKFGITADTGFFGRFYPANFVLAPGALTNRRIAACAMASTFTYAGEQFRVTFSLTAKNGAGATAQNYDAAAGFAALNAAAIASLGFGAIDLADATPPVTATALSTNLTLGTSSGTWVSGAVPVTADLMVTRAAAPNGPFESFTLGVNPVDTDGVKLSSYDLDTSVPADTNDRGLVGAGKIRFGRLRLHNAHGSDLLALPIPMETQYWNGTGFITNVDDNCTLVTTANVGLGNYLVDLSAGETTPSLPVGAFMAGRKTLTLSRPGSGNSGSTDLVVNLGSTTTIDATTTCLTWLSTVPTPAAANLPYLLGQWCGANYDRSPAARATFGTYRNSDRFIYQRENY